MIDHVAIVVLGLAFFVEKAGSFFVQRAAARERKELYDRIQAGTLADFAAHRGDQGVDSRRIHGTDDLVDVDDLTALRDELPDAAFIEAQAGFNSLMGG